MKKGKNPLIVILCLLGICALLAIVLLIPSRFAKNPAGTIGNTAGNLNNGGLFCEYNGTVYFSNSVQGGSLYAMNPDESNIKQLNNMNVRNILAGGKYIYFFQTGAASQSGFGQIQGMKSFDRCKLNGKDVTALTKDTIVTAQLVDNTLCMSVIKNNETIFYTMSPNKTNITDSVSTTMNPACVYNGLIYYNGTETNHYLYSYDPDTGVSSQIWAGNLWYPIVMDNYVYYMDVANNYRLCRYSFSTREIEILTNHRVDCFNIGSGYIYYQRNGNDAGLYCMRTNGSDAKLIASGNYTNINMTSAYVYFQMYGDTNKTYHSPIGSSSFSTFTP